MKLLDNKIIMVTGASRGIGREMAVTFAQQGATLVLVSRNEEALVHLENELDEYSNNVIKMSYDIRDLEKTKDAFKFIKKNIGRLDVLVNNAGILKERLLGMVDYEVYHETMETNLYASITHMQYASRLMSSQKQGSIINLSSIMGTNGSEGQVIYSSSKSAVIGATKSAAKELAKYNVRVNAIAPGFIDTDMSRNIKEDMYHKRISSIALGRAGTPKEIANAAMFLASDLSTYITGQVIGVDGGMVI